MASRLFRVGGIISDTPSDWFFINGTNSAARYNADSKTTTTAMYVVPAAQTAYLSKMQGRGGAANTILDPYYADTGTADDPSSPSGLIYLDRNSNQFMISTTNTLTVFDIMGMQVPTGKYIGVQEGSGAGVVKQCLQGVAF